MAESHGAGPTNTPSQKITAVGVAGAATVLIVFIASQFGLDIPDGVGEAITALIAALAGYFKREA